MRTKRQDIISVFERDFFVYRGRVPNSKVNVFDVLRSLCPNEDRATIEELASELSFMGPWVPKGLKRPQ
jgi:hypothetical protein